MIHVPFDPRVGSATLALIAQLALVAAGILLMFRVTKIAMRIVVLGVFLAVVSALLPQWIS